MTSFSLDFHFAGYEVTVVQVQYFLYSSHKSFCNYTLYSQCKLYYVLYESAQQNM